MGGPFHLTADLFPIGGIERSQNAHGTILSAVLTRESADSDQVPFPGKAEKYFVAT
jgi:hypothetical protein